MNSMAYAIWIFNLWKAEAWEYGILLLAYEYNY